MFDDYKEVYDMLNDGLLSVEMLSFMEVYDIDMCTEIMLKYDVGYYTLKDVYLLWWVLSLSFVRDCYNAESSYSSPSYESVVLHLERIVHSRVRLVLGRKRADEFIFLTTKMMESM